MISPIFKGRTAVVIATGPSLTPEVVARVMKHSDEVCLFGLNDAYRAFPYLDVLYACDGRWWDVHHAKMVAMEYQVRHGWWTQEEKAARSYPDLKRIPGVSKPGLSQDQGLIHFGSNSGYQLINVALLFGITRMLLVGYDMRRIEGEAHFFGEHPEGLTRSSGYTNFAKHYESIDPSAYGVSIVNCTPDSALTHFPRADLTKMLDAL